MDAIVMQTKSSGQSSGQPDPRLMKLDISQELAKKKVDALPVEKSEVSAIQVKGR